MPRKPHIEEQADMISEHGVSGPSVTPSLPFDEGGDISREDDEEKRPARVPAEGTDAGG